MEPQVTSKLRLSLGCEHPTNDGPWLGTAHHSPHTTPPIVTGPFCLLGVRCDLFLRPDCLHLLLPPALARSLPTQCASTACPAFASELVRTQ